ncbi:unnamed protein product, partial [Staurois parvus]
VIKTPRVPRTLHSLYLVSPNPAFTISGLPGHSPAFTISVSQDPAFTISSLPGPCIQYIWSPSLVSPCIHYIQSPQTLHSLYLISPDPAFTISDLPRPCIHYIRFPRTLHSL